MGAAIAWLAGCAAVPESAPLASRAPQLALAPAALGCAVAVQQQLTVSQPGGQTQSLEALLEVDETAVQMAFFHLGQRMGSLRWDGTQWDQQLARWWPAQLEPRQVLSDMQLALWPAAAVQAGVAAPWRVEVDGPQRRLLRGEQVAVAVRYVGDSALEITYPAGQWTLRVESPGGGQLCATAQAAP